MDIGWIVDVSIFSQQDDFSGERYDPVTDNKWLVGVYRERKGAFQGKNLSQGIGPERRGESGTFGVGW